MAIMLGVNEVEKSNKRRFRFTDDLDVLLLKCVMLHGAHIASRGSAVSWFEAVASSFNGKNAQLSTAQQDSPRPVEN
jgi:hypothetical protein